MSAICPLQTGPLIKVLIIKYISSSKNYIEQAKQKINIEFANEGIKAAAVTEIGDYGMGVCGFDYFYDIPVEKINLDF